MKRLFVIACLFSLAACGNNTAPNGVQFANNPCSISGTLQVAVAQTARVDCSNGGTTVTLAGQGASYIVVAQLATDQGPNIPIPYHVASGTVGGAAIANARFSAGRFAESVRAASTLRTMNVDAGLRTPLRPRVRQMAFDAAMRARARRMLASGAWRKGPSVRAGTSGVRPSMSIQQAVGAVGSVSQFRALIDENSGAYGTVTAKLQYVGNNILIYVDTLTPAAGFTSDQLNALGQLFDQTLYPIDTAAFGLPTDVDQNGRVVMLMTPTVNALTPTATCQASGYVAGYFNEEDLGGGVNDPDSNNGEIFYAAVPDPSGQFSCSLTETDLANTVPATFLHEVQHLISYSQHVVVHGGDPEFGWLDEGLSIVAEELGSVYYEQKCPGTACRTNAAQLFPDSSQGFVQGFLYDSYQYALLPDTNSLTLHDDSEDGFGWRGGDWLMMRWLGDQFGSAVYKTMDHSPLTGVPNIQAAVGQDFPTLFSNFGLALYIDSLPGASRATAPSVNRFLSRNVRQLWNRLWQTSGGASDVPVSSPLQAFSITADTTSSILSPGTMTYFRLDTPSGQSTVSVQFSGPGGVPLSPALRPQLAIFRLPPGQ